MFLKSQPASCFLSPPQALISSATLVSALTQVIGGGPQRLLEAPRMPASAGAPLVTSSALATGLPSVSSRALRTVTRMQRTRLGLVFQLLKSGMKTGRAQTAEEQAAGFPSGPREEDRDKGDDDPSGKWALPGTLACPGQTKALVFAMCLAAGRYIKTRLCTRSVHKSQSPVLAPFCVITQSTSSPARRIYSARQGSLTACLTLTYYINQIFLLVGGLKKIQGQPKATQRLGSAPGLRFENIPSSAGGRWGRTGHDRDSRGSLGESRGKCPKGAAAAEGTAGCAAGMRLHQINA